MCFTATMAAVIEGLFGCASCMYLEITDESAVTECWSAGL